MPSKFNPARILRTTEDDELGYNLYTFAAEFAILGYLDIARQLISLVNKHTPLHRQKQETMFKPLWLVWDLTGVWPEGEEEYAHHLKSEGDDKSTSQVVAELSEQYGKSHWDEAGFPEGEQVYDETRLKACVEKLEEFGNEKSKWYADATTGWIAMKKGSVLVKTLEIILYMQENGISSDNKDLPNAEQVFIWISQRLGANQMIVYLTQSARIWYLLKDGALAKVVGVKDEKVRELGRSILETFQARYGNGVLRSPMWEKSVQELVHTISDNTLNNEGYAQAWREAYGDDAPLHKTLLKDPLSTTDITALEHHLKISIPEDYKTFLITTNGMHGSWGGILIEPELFPDSKLRWVTEKSEYVDDLTADIFPDIFHEIRDLYDSDEWPTVGEPLEIGREDIESVWLLPPSKVTEIKNFYLRLRDQSPERKTMVEKAITSWAGSVEDFQATEWWVMTWVGGGAVQMDTFPSFKAFLVYKAEASAENDETEKNENMCFSYSCR